MSAMSPTCVVADDHPSVLEVVCDVLQAAGATVVARAADGAEALAKIEQHRPDVAVVDVMMPRLTGLEVVCRAAAASPATAVVLYTGYGDAAMVAEALEAGARGFVLKESPLDDLVHAVDSRGRRRDYVDRLLVAVPGPAGSSVAPRLTPRERDVLSLLAEGLSNDEIGVRLAISAETVRSHTRKAMTKLGGGDADAGGGDGTAPAADLLVVLLEASCRRFRGGRATA